MRRMIGWTLAATLVVALASAHADVTVSQVVSLKDLKADYAAGKYQECLKKIAGATGLAQMSAADRAALMSLKAECLLATKQGPAASEAFLGAAAAFTTAKDSKSAATCKATVTLIHSSTDYAYISKNGADKTPLPIIDPSKRPAALSALFDDQLAGLLDGYKGLLQKSTLADILAFAPRLQDLDLIEIGASGADSKSSAMQKGLAGAAKTDIDNFLATSNKIVDGIALKAGQTVPGASGGGSTGGGNGNGTGKGGGKGNNQPKQPKGLSDQDKTTLNNIATATDKIQPECKSLCPALSLDVDYFKAQVTGSSALRSRIDSILGGNFNVTGGITGP